MYAPPIKLANNVTTPTNAKITVVLFISFYYTVLYVQTLNLQKKTLIVFFDVFQIKPNNCAYQK